MRPQRTAALLSALLPGLGQFYNRDWGKGIAFLVAMGVADAALNVTADTVRLFRVLLNATSQSMDASLTPPDLGSLLLHSIPVFAIVLWSVVDAARTARAGRRERANAGLTR